MIFCRAKLNIPRVLAALAAVLCAFLLSGCGASLTVYDYYENGKRVNEYVLTIDGDTVRAMERSAISDADGRPYTVENYFYTLFSGFGYEVVEASKTDESGYRAVYKKTFRDGATPELFSVGAATEYSAVYTDTPFTREVTQVSPSPFNGVREAYDSVRPGQSAQVIQQLKNGIVTVNERGETIVVFPPVQDAFPYLAGYDPEGLLLSYATVGSNRMSSSGIKTEGDGNAVYVFPRYFDTSETQMAFTYTRPVPYGWYLVALAAGAVVLAVFVLVTREKKQKPTLLDRFPYNPEEYRDYESHLPTTLR